MNNPLAAALEKKIVSRKAKVAGIGLGYVGLPLVKAFLNKGFSVIGVDVDSKKIKMLNQGRSYIKHISTAELRKYLSLKTFQATSDFSRLAAVDAVLICVPTPLDAHRNPDLSYVLNTTRTIAARLRRGHLVVLESTTYPGTPDEEMKPILAQGGL